MFLKNFKKGIAFTLAGVMALTVVSSADIAGKTARAADATTESFDSSKTYHATLGIQTCNTLWVERMGYYAKGIGNYNPYGEANWSKLTYMKDGERVTTAGTFTDAEITGNGTYTVKLENADFLNETTISQLQVATDLPLNSPVTISDVALTINDKEIMKFDKAYMEDEEAYISAGLVILLYNHWRSELENKVKDLGFSIDGSGLKLLTGTGNDNISISFTVSGYEEEPLPMPTAPGKATISSAKNSKAKSIVVKYKKQTDAIGYQVQYSTNKNFKKNKKTKSTKKTSYTIKKLKTKTTYYVRVRAYSKGYTGNLYGSWSAVKKVKVKK